MTPKAETMTRGDVPEGYWKRLTALLNGDTARELQARFDALTARCEAAERSRNSVIEECAKVCEKRAERRWEEHGHTEHDTNASYYPKQYEWCGTADEEVEDCASAIRALKTPDAKLGRKR